MRKYACVRVTFTVFFDDDEENDLRDQAIDAAKDQFGLHFCDADIEVIGSVDDA